MLQRLMGQWTNSNIHRTVTDGPFWHVNMSKGTFDNKKKNPYWQWHYPISTFVFIIKTVRWIKPLRVLINDVLI